MNTLNDLIASLDKANEKDIKEIHEFSNNLRKLADLFDLLVKEETTAEEIEEIMGKIIVIALKLNIII